MLRARIHIFFKEMNEFMQGRGEKGGKGKEVWGKEEKHHEKYHSSKEGRQLKKSRITKEAHEA